MHFVLTSFPVGNVLADFLFQLVPFSYRECHVCYKQVFVCPCFTCNNESMGIYFKYRYYIHSRMLRKIILDGRLFFFV